MATEDQTAMLTMLDYVKMANNKLAANLAESRDLAADLVGAYVASGCRTVRIVASGSSKNSARCARNYMQEVLDAQVIVTTPEAYVAFDASYPNDAFDIVVSQSGYSTNSIAAVDFAVAQGRPVIALTGNLGSPIASHGCPTFDYGVGVESVDFVTMGVQTLVEYLMFFSLYAAHATGLIDDGGLEQGLADIAQAIEAHAQVLTVAERFVTDEKIVLSRQAPVMLVGNGPNFGVVEEAALKLNETMKLAAMFFEGEEFIHGPEMQMVPGYLAFLVDDAQGSERMANTFLQLKGLTDGIFFLTSNPRGIAGEVVMPKLTNPFVASIPNLAFFQYLAAQKAEELKRWDVHPYLDAIGNALGSKAAGYEDSVRTLEERARQEYGN